MLAVEAARTASALTQSRCLATNKFKKKSSTSQPKATPSKPTAAKVAPTTNSNNKSSSKLSSKGPAPSPSRKATTVVNSRVVSPRGKRAAAIASSKSSVARSRSRSHVASKTASTASASAAPTSPSSHHSHQQQHPQHHPQQHQQHHPHAQVVWPPLDFIPLRNRPIPRVPVATLNFHHMPMVNHELRPAVLQPGTHPMRDLLTGEERFPDYYRHIESPEEIDFDNIPSFVTASRDPTLRHVASQVPQTRFISSSSSSTGVLSQLYYLFSNFRPIDPSYFSMAFQSMPMYVTVTFNSS